MHNVATSETKAIPASQQMPAVVVMAQVSSSYCFASICASALAPLSPLARSAQVSLLGAECFSRRGNNQGGGCRTFTGMSGLATRMAMSGSGASHPTTLCVRSSKPCILTSGAEPTTTTTTTFKGAHMARSSYWPFRLPVSIVAAYDVPVPSGTTCFHTGSCNTQHASLPDHAVQAMQPQLKECPSCRCIDLDDDGNAWVGSEAGNVKKIEQVNLKQPAGGLSKWLEVKVVLKWSREVASSTSGQSSTPTDSLSSRAQSIAASALGMLHTGSCGSCGSQMAMACIPYMRDRWIGSAKQCSLARCDIIDVTHAATCGQRLTHCQQF